MGIIKWLIFIITTFHLCQIGIDKVDFKTMKHAIVDYQDTPVKCVQKYIFHQESRNIDSLLSTVNCYLYMKNMQGVIISSENKDEYCAILKDFILWQWQLSDRIWNNKQDKAFQDSLKIDDTNYSCGFINEITNMGNSVVLVDSIFVFKLYLDNDGKTWIISGKDVYDGTNFRL